VKEYLSGINIQVGINNGIASKKNVVFQCIPPEKVGRPKKRQHFSSFSDWPMSVYALSTEILTHSDLKRPSV